MPHKDDGKKKVFDVSKPGETAASASSKPVIVGHKTLLPDPMVTRQIPIKKVKSKPDSNDVGSDNEAASGEPDNEVKMLNTSEITIVPPTSDDTTNSKPPAEPTSAPLPEESKVPEETKVPDPVKESTESDKVAEDVAAEDTKVEPKEKEAQPAVTETSTDSDDQPDSNGEDAPSKTSDKTSTEDKETKDDDRAQAEAAQKEVYKKLVDNKTYFAPIGEQKRKRSMRRFLLVVILLLCILAAAADVLIDNGTIKTNIKPPVRIFHNIQ